MEANVLNQMSVSVSLAVAQPGKIRNIFNKYVSWKKFKVRQWFKVHQWLKDKDLQNIKLIRWDWYRVFISDRFLTPCLSYSFIIFVYNHRMYSSFNLIQPNQYFLFWLLFFPHTLPYGGEKHICVAYSGLFEDFFKITMQTFCFIKYSSTSELTGHHNVILFITVSGLIPWQWCLPLSV